jgi:hypothetical protein
MDDYCDECIVVLEPGVFLADGKGDPPRTCDLKNAKVFPSITAARSALFEAREFRPFDHAAFLFPTLS